MKLDLAVWFKMKLKTILAVFNLAAENSKLFIIYHIPVSITPMLHVCNVPVHY